MAGKLDEKGDHHGMLLSPQPKDTNGLSTDQIGNLIIEMNCILRNEFYPYLGNDKTCQFEEIWGAVQGLLCAEAICAAQSLAKATHDSPAKQLPAPSYAAVAQANHPPPRGDACQLPGSNQSPGPLPGRCEFPAGNAPTLLRTTCGTQPG